MCVGQGVRYFCLLSYVRLQLSLKQFQGFCIYSGFKSENSTTELSHWHVTVVATHTSCWGTLELVCSLVSQSYRHWSTPPGSLGCNTVIPVSAGTDAAILSPSYLASLPSCAGPERCQMSGFNTEPLQGVPLQQPFSSSYKCIPYSFHTPPPFNHGNNSFCWTVSLGVQPESILWSSVLVPKSGQSPPASSCSHHCLHLLPKQSLSHLPQGAVINHVFLLVCHVCLQLLSSPEQF